jgi:hypothetical protein
LLKDRLPAYISWAQFEHNQTQLAANQTTDRGAIRSGAALLSGLIFCGRCGLRMASVYNSSGDRLRYACNQMAINYAEALCQSLVGQLVDDWVSAQVLRALEPAALEISLQVAADLEGERQHLHQHWRQRLERAHYQVERTARQYQTVEPEHRLVARTLERQWEEALAAEAALQADYARFQAEQPPVLTADERATIRQLATAIPALWQAPTTTSADRQAIIRQVVERVVINVHGESERVDVQIHWWGGHGTQATLIRPVARLDQLSDYPQLTARVRALHAAGNGPTAIARQLNAEGWRPAKRCETFNGPMISALQVRLGLRTPPPPVIPHRQANEWTLAELAHRLDIPPPTLFAWLRRGRLQGRQVAHGAHMLWLIHADTQDLEQIQIWRTTVPAERRLAHQQ